MSTNVALSTSSSTYTHCISLKSLPTSCKLYKTVTSSTRVSRNRQHRVHYVVRLTPRKTGKPNCRNCSFEKRVTFVQKCAYKVYDVATGEIVGNGIEDVDFQGGKVVGLLRVRVEEEGEGEGEGEEW